MDTITYTYPHLFDMDDSSFDPDLFSGFNLSSPNNMYNLTESKKPYTHQDFNNTSNNTPNNMPDIYTSLAANSNSYLHYLQSTTPPNNNNNSNNNNNNNTSELSYINSTNNQASSINLEGLDLADYDYFQQQNSYFQQKQQYNWLYDSADTYLPSDQSHLFCDESMAANMLINPQPMNPLMSENSAENITVEGGMSRGYVSLSDVNSFVAKADSIKHSCLLQLDLSEDLLDDFCPSSLQRDFSSSESNEDSEDEYSDSEEAELRWPSVNSSFNMSTTSSMVGASLATAANKSNNPKNKLMIKIKKPSSNNSSALPSPYGESHHNWDSLISPKQSKSASYRNKYRKSMSNIYNTAVTKKKTNKFDNKRRGSAPNRLTLHNSGSTNSLASLHSSSSLTSLSNNLQRSMRVSDSINSFLSEEDQYLHPVHSHHHHNHNHNEGSDNESHLMEEDEEDDDDEDYQLRTGSNPALPTTKKGRNVDKACNHCKRSHLRCDDMRPCRRCMATGKTGCKDVQHKPRGRPKLHKK